MQTSKLPGKQTQAALSTEDGELQGETQLPHSTIKRELSFAEVQIFFISLNLICSAKQIFQHLKNHYLLFPLAITSPVTKVQY